MRRLLTPPIAERLALLLLVVLSLLAFLLAPPIAQPQQYHGLADQRALTLSGFVLPNAADVLTSFLFTVVGGAGLLHTHRARSVQRRALALFFAALVLTGFGSAWYHLSPNDQSLVWDRLPMTAAFAGAVGAVAAERRGPQAGIRWLLGWLLLGLVSIAVWVTTGDLRLYGLAQFGGFAVLLLWLRLPAVAGAVRLPWGLLLGAYAVAKGFEMLDREVWVVTGGMVAGHALKHVVVALGVVPLVWALSRRLDLVGHGSSVRDAHKR